MAIKSLKSHYIISSILLFIALVVAFSYSSHIVSYSSNKSLDNVNINRDMQLASSKIRDSVWETDFNINAYILVSSPRNRNKLKDQLNKLIDEVEQLTSNNQDLKRNRRMILDSLKQKILTLRLQADRLIELREDQSKRFPTLSILENTLYPINQEFVTTASLSIDDIDIKGMSEDESEYYSILTSTARLWHRMILSFRLFVAYRTETITNPIAGMSNSLLDIDTLHNGVMRNLDRLKQLEESNQVAYLYSDTTDELIELADLWHKSFDVVSDIYTSSEWRKDDKIIVEELQPLSQEIRNLLQELDEKISQSFHTELASLTDLALQISNIIWLLGLVTLVFISAGYIYIKKFILNPVSDVAAGLKRQKDENMKLELPRSRTAEINILVDAFNELSHSLADAEQTVRQSDKLATVGELASCVAHEINNPLNNMSMIVELTQEEIENMPDHGHLKKDIDILHHEIDRCASIVQNLLDFGRMKEPTTELISLSDILNESIYLLHHKASINNITINRDIADDLPDIVADPSQLHQVFVNLILNAIDFSHADTSILISMKVIDEHICCHITDQGSGVPQEKLDKLFDPFYTSRKGHNGMGLGLSVCDGIIRHHQGEIGAYNNEQSGLTVWFTLPLTDHSSSSSTDKSDPETHE